MVQRVERMMDVGRLEHPLSNLGKHYVTSSGLPNVGMALATQTNLKRSSALRSLPNSVSA
jgi:hypothetical protein